MLSIKECKIQILQIFLQYCYSAILKVELHYSTILKHIIFFYSHFLTLSLSLCDIVCFSSHSSLHYNVTLSSHLSLTVGYSGVGRASGMEVRLGKSNQRGMVAISGYFWVHFMGSWVCGGVVWWFAVACSWVSGVVCSGKINL